MLTPSLTHNRMSEPQSTYHTPVLLAESVDGLNIGSGGAFVDVTFGGGGHSREILRRMDTSARLYSLDQDADAEQNAGALASDTRWQFVRTNFRYLRNWARYYGLLTPEGEPRVDGILADLGVSSHHLDDAERGFSLRFDAPLDMRMNKRGGQTAADIVNGYAEEHLADVIFLYGELRQARRMAAAICRARTEKPINTTGQLLDTVAPLLPRQREKKDAARLFQALRIEVNHEMQALAEMLAAATDILKPGGRLAVITYHSLEDRMVKNVMRSGNTAGRITKDFYGQAEAPFRLVTQKPVTPSEAEQSLNPRSRSAKLRVAERL